MRQQNVFDTMSYASFDAAQLFKALMKGWSMWHMPGAGLMVVSHCVEWAEGLEIEMRVSSLQRVS